MHPTQVVALGYRYPNPTHRESLATAVASLSSGVASRQMGQFLDEVSELELGQWEELHTRTLDLSPAFVPYVGHVTWGENYRRGEFMADLKRDMTEHGVDLGGELPDHIEPILRYLAVVPEPRADLLEVLPGAVTTMESTLAAADKANPYRHVLAATVAVVQDLKPVMIGVAR
ncbi:MAG: nitrate reductase [Actinomycetia bacterium]|nr:nitrate reductase [Actinomycetes bacterium]MCP4224094.1 nitrate reductase [Actinomycetes bacterium]MCP5034604.1 nitrate reductase [Actinomycetes bacterium]